ncbi:MAG: tRNA pseudouridine(55) synthase TruB [Alphaproteobacteria bacterium]|nr:tRNA pseudouridine(55) synthase TruB [Alphaproteobacteria bacterium]MDE2339645.1 tRNA pseudouridine(55) synthase TruB [Alphaproteobacteria bacterium]
MHGWIILDKPYGMGSTTAVSAVKRILLQAGYGKIKVGHGGTLDPLATGMLPIAVGEATKLAGRMLDADKVYEFTIQFGVETDTLDAEGKVVASSDVRPGWVEIEDVLPRFTGPIRQRPPAFSALKVEGKRAYDLARAGGDVVLAERAVEIKALTIIETTPDTLTLSTTVSKGTYIRSLARDIAHALGTVGHVTILRRIKAGPFSLNQTILLDFLEEAAKRGALAEHILPLRTALADIPVLALTPEQATALKQGKVLAGIEAPDGLNFAQLDDVPTALVMASHGEIRVERGFNL